MSAGEGARGEGGWTRDEAGGGGGRRRIIVGALDLDTILDFGLVCQRYENFLDPKDTKTLSDSKDTKTFWIQKIRKHSLFEFSGGRRRAKHTCDVFRICDVGS